MTTRKVGVALILLTLVGLPLVIALVIYESYRRQDARDDELEAKYECEPANTCSGDFTGDGLADRVNVINALTSGPRFLTVVSNGREILRLPYDHTDGTLRTHTAVISDGHPSRLLIYDGVCYPTPLRGAFGWNGEEMVTVPPSDLEREIINAMAAHDDTGGWHERAFRSLFNNSRTNSRTHRLLPAPGNHRWRDPLPEILPSTNSKGKIGPVLPGDLSCYCFLNAAAGAGKTMAG